MTPLANIHMWSKVVGCHVCCVLVFEKACVVELVADGQPVLTQSFDSLAQALDAATALRSTHDLNEAGTMPPSIARATPLMPNWERSFMKRALIVDDDHQVSALMERWLLTAGYDVVVANDFGDATMQIRLRTPDIVVTDVRLGAFNGLQIALLARQVRSDVHLVIMSAWDDCVVRRDATELGAAFMQKPFRVAELLAAIASHECVASS